MERERYEHQKFLLQLVQQRSEQEKVFFILPEKQISVDERVTTTFHWCELDNFVQTYNLKFTLVLTGISSTSRRLLGQKTSHLSK